MRGHLLGGFLGKLLHLPALELLLALEEMFTGGFAESIRVVIEAPPDV